MSNIIVNDYLRRIERIRNGDASIGDVSMVNLMLEVFGRDNICSCGEGFDCDYNLQKHKDICHPYGYGIRDTCNMIPVPKLVFNIKVKK